MNELTDFKCQIQTASVPKEERLPHLFYYDMRHGENWCKPNTIEKFVGANHCCTLISNVDLSVLFIRQDYYKVNNKMRDIIYNKLDCGAFDGKELFAKITI